MPIDHCIVKRILIDTASSANILFKCTFLQMDISWSRVKPYILPLVGFTGQTIHSKRKFSLRGNVWNTAYMVEFIIISALSEYNHISGRSVLNQLRVEIVTCDLSMKIFYGSETPVINGDRQTAKKCYFTIAREVKRKEEEKEEETKIQI